MRIKVDSTFHLSNSGILGLSSYDDLMFTSIYCTISLDFTEDLSEEEWCEREETGGLPDDIQIGHIYAHRFDLDYDPETLFLLGHARSSDLANFVSFFFLDEGKKQKSFDYLFYLDDVFIEIPYRGKNYALQALALFLQGFAWGETVGCFPEDLRGKNSNLESQSREKGKFLMRKYWSKLGLDRYSANHNILWTDEWYMPSWLRDKVLPNSIDSQFD
ncbi:hypothetical protein PJF56_04435 [Roseofilum sp. BLCC_M91]|uniref:N-acetyltransferase domain-containing protein n=1 Tax=Roseofilum halophilum BLCC-M91 TaxID=3022259 RepID=A0ABT7BG16_9CYAN|nr:hypothetical protein [Roseofilum halophilum]MDJ1178106.1 hypothetical protein [Roseofilum halophilum BLCC-M91]